LCVTVGGAAGGASGIASGTATAAENGTIDRALDHLVDDRASPRALIVRTIPREDEAAVLADLRARIATALARLGMIEPDRDAILAFTQPTPQTQSAHHRGC
jgi:hypothetical protein